jgi:hypothetical protein
MYLRIKNKKKISLEGTFEGFHDDEKYTGEITLYKDK